MATTLEEVKAKLLANKARGNKGNNQNLGDNASYPFWNIPVGTSATIRFLPDGNPENTFFWRNREVIRLPFQGVVGGDYPTDKAVSVTVPCVEMWGMPCPIISATRPWWKDDDKKEIARLYWKKKSYITQGFVVNSSLDEEHVPENPIRRFVINPSIYEIIEKSLIDPEMEDMPTDYIGGRDFKLAKTQKGEYANYATSSWSMKVRSLSETEMGSIATHGLNDLNTFLGRKPDADELDAIKAMFEASVAGDPYDMESFGKYFRPYGSRNATDDIPSTPVARTETVQAPVQAASAPAETVTEAVTTETVVQGVAPAKPNPQDILERIRQRNNAK